MPSVWKAGDNSAVMVAVEWRPAREMSWRVKLESVRERRRISKRGRLFGLGEGGGG